MPFTLSHPAAALPFRSVLGSLGSASALVAGSMVPDLPYFVPLGIDGPESHSAAGILWFDLPAGIALWVIYAVLVRAFVLDLLPLGVLRRLDHPEGRPILAARRLVAVAVSVVVGATTHVVWDAFTHASGAGVDLFPSLGTPVRVLDGYAPETYTLLQLGSSLGGLVVLGIWAVRWYRRTPPRVEATPSRLPRAVRALALAAVLMPSAVTGLVIVRERLSVVGVDDLRLVQQSIGQAIFSAGSVFLLMLVLTALALTAGRGTRWRSAVDSQGRRA